MFEPVQTSDSPVLGAYFQASDGGWYLTAEAKAEALAMYYSGRLAYSNEDRRMPIGRYSPTGEVVPFSRHHVSAENGA